MKTVRIRITGNEIGVGLVFPYDHLLNPNEKPLYRVPTYQVVVNNSSFFTALRFGYRAKFERPWPSLRACDEGILVQRECVAQWNGGYSPHSFGEGNGLQGGFLIRKDQVYIHQGPARGNAAGTLSCVEVMSDTDGDDWNRFLATVAKEAGVLYVGKAVQQHKVLVTVEAALLPVGLLVGRLVWREERQGFRYDVVPDWATTTVPWKG